MNEGDRILVGQAAAFCGWQPVRLGDVIDLNPKRDLARGTKAPFAAMTDVLEHYRLIPSLDTREYNGGGSRFANGDTLLARITPSLENGKTAWVSGLPGDVTGHGSTEFIVLSAKEGVTDPLFVYYLARSPRFRSYAIGQMTGTSGRQRVPTDAVESFEVAIPPFVEQREIAKVLGALDDKVEQNRQSAQALEQLVQAIFRAWFMHFEPVKDKTAGTPSFPFMPQQVFDTLSTGFVDSHAGPVPEGWQIRALSAICTLVSGGTPRRSNPSYWSGDVPWYSVKDAPGEGEIWVINTDEAITQDGLAESAARLVPKGCTIISARGTIGKLAMAGMPMAFNQSCYGLLPRDGKSFRYLYLLAHTMVAELQRKTHGSVFDTITRTTFDGLMVVTPPPNVLWAFEELVAPFFDLMLSSLQESVKLAKLRDYLLSKLLSGQIRVVTADG